MSTQEQAERQRSMFSADPGWLAGYHEDVLEPQLPIVDPHHHLWDRDTRYMLDEFRADFSGGHKVEATVFVQCDAMYRAGGDPDFAPLGETEFVNGIAAMSASGNYGPTRVAAGIVGFAELRLGARVAEVLDAHVRVGGGRFRGIRGRSVWDADPSIKGSAMDFPPHLLMDPAFREGFACLAPRGLSFDAWLFHPQISELTDLAGRFPETTIILDHVGAPLGVGVYAGKRDEVFADWRRNLAELARRPNVSIKIGGLGMHLFDFGLDAAHRERPASSEELARVWQPYVETSIELFGPERAMFESNFPVDKRAASYTVLWNAFKRLTHAYSDAERQALFKETACRVYRLPF